MAICSHTGLIPYPIFVFSQATVFLFLHASIVATDGLWVVTSLANVNHLIQLHAVNFVTFKSSKTFFLLKQINARESF